MTMLVQDVIPNDRALIIEVFHGLQEGLRVPGVGLELDGERLEMPRKEMSADSGRLLSFFSL